MAEGQTGGCTDGREEFLPILQDFVPCWGRCTSTLCNLTTSKKQGKGTADLMILIGDRFWACVFCYGALMRAPGVTNVWCCLPRCRLEWIKMQIGSGKEFRAAAI